MITPHLSLPQTFLFSTHHKTLGGPNATHYSKPVKGRCTVKDRFAKQIGLNALIHRVHCSARQQALLQAFQRVAASEGTFTPLFHTTTAKQS